MRQVVQVLSGLLVREVKQDSRAPSLGQPAGGAAEIASGFLRGPFTGGELIAVVGGEQCVQSRPAKTRDLTGSAV